MTAADVASRCEGAKQTASGWTACCPVHEDHTPSLTLADGEKGVVLYCQKSCETTDILQALGLQWNDVFHESRAANGTAPGKRDRGRYLGSTFYDYVDEVGTLLFQTERLQYEFDKTFQQRQPNGASGWVYNLKNVRRVLYRLPQTLAALQTGQAIVIAEGEKAVEALVALGIPATCNPMGAGKNKWRPEFATSLQGAHIIVLPDNDTDGRGHATRIAESLHGHAASLRVVTLPGLPVKGDAFEWIAAGGTREQLEALVNATPLWTPAQAQTPAPAARPGTAADPDVPYSDDFNAQLFAREHGQDVRYCHLWGKWLVWTDTHWQIDTSGAVMRLAKAPIRTLGHRALDTDDKELLKHVKTSLGTAKLKALLEGAASEPGIPVQPEDLDANPWLLNCANGTLDLRTGMLQPHRREDLLTRHLEVAYDPRAPCPTWMAFLATIMGGNEALLTFLQRALGYALSGSTREQCLFVLHGSGANGKSTFLEALQSLLGSYAQSTPSATLLVKDRHDGIPNDVARLRGARFVSAVEIGEGKRLNEELIKRLTGQDTLTARFLFAEFFDFKPEFKLFVACNHLPQIRGNDHAIWRRVKLVPFAVTIPPEQQDKDLPEKLRHERVGILAWAVQGGLAWLKEGLAAPADVIKATENYRTEQDRMGQFLEDLCTTHSSYQATTSSLYEAYTRWCKENGEDFPLPSKIFGARLGEHGFTDTRIGKARNRGWRGVRLLTQDELDLREYEATEKAKQAEKTDESQADIADIADIKIQELPREENTTDNHEKSCPPMSAMSANGHAPTAPLCPHGGPHIWLVVADGRLCSRCNASAEEPF